MRRAALVLAMGLVVSVPAQAQWLDPDRRWNADQWQHAALGAALDVIVRGPWVTKSWRDTWAKRFAWSMALGCVALETYQVYESAQRGWLGQEGGGFGLLDCAAVAMGALAMEIVVAGWHAVRR